MDKVFEEQLNQFILNKAIIPKSLGLWERYFKKMCLAWQDMKPEIQAQHIIFSADNGISVDGLIGYNYEITRKQSQNMIDGKSAVANYCIFNHIPYEVVDVGIACPQGIGINRKVAQGTKNILDGAAMSAEEFDLAYQAGYNRVVYYAESGINLFSFGEMGVGNTTTSAAVLSGLTKLDPRITVGPGSGPDEEAYMNQKREFVRTALSHHKGHLNSPKEVISRVGGFDIAAITGAMVACTGANKSTTNEGAVGENDAFKALEKRREYYKAQDKERAELEAEDSKLQIDILDTKLKSLYDIGKTDYNIDFENYKLLDFIENFCEYKAAF